MLKPELIHGEEVNAFLETVNDHWNPLPAGALASVLKNEAGEIVAISAAYPIYAAGGSWVRPSERRKGLSKITRIGLENTLRAHGESVYVSFPQNQEEKNIFAAYGGLVTERTAQVKGL